MATKVIMPALGMAQETGIVVAWLKQEGEQVVAGEPLMEVETDKTTAELEAPATGILAAVSAHDGDEVPVAEIIAWILEPGEEVPVSPSTDGREATPAVGIPASPVALRMAADHGLTLTQIPNDGRRITKADVESYLSTQNTTAAGSTAALLQPASPKARRLAREAGLPLAEIDGSGPEGAVITADVLAAQAGRKPAPAAVVDSTSGRPESIGRAWMVMAGRLAEAWRTIPHFYLERDIDVTEMLAWQETARQDSDTKITITDLLTRAVAAALKQHPRLNASWLNETIQLNDEIHVGLAVAVEEGLVVPVIPHTDRLSVAEIAVRRQGIVGRALEGRLKTNDLLGGTFTISNLGMFGIDRFSAIVNPPQAAILAVGKIIERAVPLNGEIVSRPLMTMTLSADHRVVDGARGAAFLATLAGFLEQPLRLL